MGLARVDILNLINKKKYSDAREQANDLVKDFRDEPEAGVALFQIGQEFGWQRRYVESKEAFDHLINDFPNSSPAQEAKLWSARAGICAIIGKAKDEDIVKAIDNLMSDFEGNSGLADAIFWIGREYEWTRGASNINKRDAWYEAPNNDYKRLLSQFNYSQADWDYKRLNHRMKIFKLISEPNQDKTNEAIENMVTEFAGRPELAGELYWIACGYEEQNQDAHAKRMYERIVKEYSDTVEANNAVLDGRRLDIWEMLKAGDINEANSLTVKYIADFQSHPYAGACLVRVMISSFMHAIELQKENQSEQAKNYLKVTDDIGNKIKVNNLQNGNDAVYFYYYTACNYQRLNQWDKAIECYQKVVDDWPDYEFAGGCQAAVGWCYEAMRDNENLPKEVVNLIVEEAYKKVLANYPDSYINHFAAFRLAELSDEKNDKSNAIAYYKKFLELAKPGNSQIAYAQEKLANMERFNRELNVEGGISK